MHVDPRTGAGSKEKAMNASSRIVVSTGLALASALVSVSGAWAEDYGRAGGGVGADRVLTVSRTAVTSGSGDVDLGKWYGIAGGPVGADAVARIANTKVTPIGNSAFDAGLGRAGGPVSVLTAVQRPEKVAHVE
jgi:hypothetical protein